MSTPFLLLVVGLVALVSIAKWRRGREREALTGYPVLVLGPEVPK
jgi:hypothetical protein